MGAVVRLRAKGKVVGHPCCTCGKLFPQPRWHCFVCDEHWEMNEPDCGDCGFPRKDSEFEFECIRKQ